MADGVNKGPADATIKQVSAEEADAAWGDGAGPVGTLADRNAGKALPTSGIRCVSPGGEGVATEPDTRAAANLAARKARAKNGGKAPPQPAAEPVAPLEDWEVAVAAEIAKKGPTEAPASPQKAAEVGQGSPLDRARKRALGVLSAIPAGFQLHATGTGIGPEGMELLMGIGYLVGAGQAASHEAGHYCITNLGRKAYIEGN